ncbi:MAG: hypothetical protein DME42_10755 [Verrucomicrobia bacterium]|nr:MAG: hypothetical protein DME42_10755 [Verrucomicrobiota bacterium]
MCSPTFTRWHTKPGTPCTPGSPPDRSSFKITITRSFWPKLRAPLTKNSSLISCWNKRAIRKCAPTSLTDRSMTFAEAGGALTLDVFKSEYRKLLDAYFGDAVVIDTVLELECLRIPHFYNAFYVYKYATGLSAAVALSQRVLNNESGAVEKYLGFLKSGGSKFPLETLRNAGVDMATPEPIKSTTALFEKRLNELEALL